jgi:hypothetical protein
MTHMGQALVDPLSINLGRSNLKTGIYGAKYKLPIKVKLIEIIRKNWENVRIESTLSIRLLYKIMPKRAISPEINPNPNIINNILSMVSDIAIYRP